MTEDIVRQNKTMKKSESYHNAYHTIADLWNADVAAERLIDLCENIIFAKKTKSPYENGICSEAKVMENDWFGK